MPCSTQTQRHIMGTGSQLLFQVTVSAWAFHLVPGFSLNSFCLTAYLCKARSHHFLKLLVKYLILCCVVRCMGLKGRVGP